MAEHFGSLGFSRIAFCGHTLGRARWRVDGFREGLAAFGRELALIVPMEGNRTFADGADALERILTNLPDCDAVFFGSDILAVGALLAARRRGIEIPRQLAIAGSGDLDFAQHVDPAVTSVRVSDYEMGKRAGEMLLLRLNGGRVSDKVVEVPPRLVVRVSTAGVPGKN
jgi:LacI family gluconate utilization system Gnt-I transcriptional repressor